MGRDLVGVQTFLSTAVRRETPTPNDPPFAQAAAEHVTGNDRLSPAEQVDIYRQQFFWRHEALLREDYPGLQWVLGHDAAHAFFHRYLEAFPPSTPLVRDLGLNVPTFAETYEAFDPSRRQIAIDMARYEAAIVTIFDGVDAPALDPSKLAGLSEDAWQTMRIVLHPLFTRLSLSYPVHRLRVAVKNGQTPVLPDAPEPVHVALFRKDLITRYEELSAEAFELLGLLAAGEPLVPALERVAEALSDERKAHLAESIGGWFQAWTAWGIIVDIAPGELSRQSA